MAKRREPFVYHVPPDSPQTAGWAPRAARRPSAPLPPLQGARPFERSGGTGRLPAGPGRLASAPPAWGGCATMGQTAGGKPSGGARSSGGAKGPNVALIAIIAVVAIAAGVIGYVMTRPSTAPRVIVPAGPPNLKAELLGVNDLPTGWAVDTSSDGNDGSEPSCFAAADKGTGTSTDADAEFARDPAFLSENLSYFPGTGATSAMASLTGALSSCKTISFATDGMRFSGAVAALSVTPLGDQSSAWQVSFVAGDGTTFTMDLVAIRVQQTLLVFVYGDLGAPDPATLQAILERGVGRVP